MKEPRKDILLWIIFFHNRVHLRVHRLGEVKTWQWHYKAHVYPDVFMPQTVSFHHCAFIFPLPTIKWSSSVWGLKIWYFGIYWINHILLTQGEICGVHCAAGMAKVITIVFSSMLSQWLKETASWPNRISNQFLLCWDHIPFVRVPRWLVRSVVMVYTVMCNHWNISFHGLSAHSGNLHGPRLRACLSARLCATAFPSNPDPASDKPIHGSMGWFIQHNFAAAQRFVI